MGSTDDDGDSDTLEVPSTQSIDSAQSDTASDAGSDPDTETVGYVEGFDNRTPVEPEVTDEGGVGNVTTYGSVVEPSPSQGGACNYGNTEILSYAAISVNVTQGDDQGQWDGGQLCGQCADVWAETPVGIKTTVVRITDKCPDEYCGIDLGGLPARELMGIQAGRYDGGWTFVPCDGHENVSDGPPAIFVKEGSSAYWSLIQLRNPPAKVVSIAFETVTASGNLEWATEAENFFSLPETVRQAEGEVTLSIVYDFDLADTVITTAAALTAPLNEIPIS